MNRFVKLFFIFLLAIVLLGVLATWGLYNAPKATVESKPVDYTLTATELFEDYNKDQSAADQKYIDQIIQISGTILERFEDQQGAPVFLLQNSDQMPGVLCTLVMDEKDKVANKKPGDSITLKGVCTGMLMEVVLNRCELVE